MQEKMKNYLNALFSALPDTEEVRGVKEELYASMVDRYNDCLAEGMDEQEAYDTVIDGIGDLRELFDELKEEKKEDNASYQQGRSAADSVADFVNQVVDFTGGFVSGLFNRESENGAPLGGVQLVNTCELSLEGIRSIEISYMAESIQLFHAEGTQLMIKEYMNREEPALFANVNISGGSILVRNGRRQGYFGLRSRVEVFLPASWQGSLALATVSGSIKSPDVWEMAAFSARTISGEVEMNAIKAATVRLSSTSGKVKAEKADGNLEMRSISGAIRLGEGAGGGVFKTTSGSVRINFNQLRGNIEASSVSGGVRIGVPQDASFEFEGHSVSGGIHTGFDDRLVFQRRKKAHGFVGGAPFYHIKASSTSGSIHVND